MTDEAGDFTFKLLELPPEIRVEILRCALVKAYPIRGCSNIQWKERPTSAYVLRNYTWQTSAENKPTGQILRTCKQMYREGNDMLYQENSLAITLLISSYNGRHMFDFLGYNNIVDATIRYRRLRHVKRYFIDVNVDPALKGKDIFRHVVPGLDISCTCLHYASPNPLEFLHVRFTYGGLDACQDAELVNTDQSHDEPDDYLHALLMLRASRVKIEGASKKVTDVLCARILADPETSPLAQRRFGVSP